MILPVHLLPPLNNTAGQAVVKFDIAGAVTMQTVVDALIDRFGPEMRHHLYDTQGRIVPAWCVFVNHKPIQLNRPESLQVALQDGDELTFLLNIAGG